MSGGSFIAPGAPVYRSGSRRAFEIARDLLLAILVVWAIPVAWAIVTALLRFVVGLATG
jgi:hypothetical protein